LVEYRRRPSKSVDYRNGSAAEFFPPNKGERQFQFYGTVAILQAT